MNLKDSVALVTGAGRGIGKSIAIDLGKTGSKVILVARTKPEIESVKSEIVGLGGKAEAYPLDLTDDRAIAELFKHIEKIYGRLDLLINNAGIGRFAYVRDMRVEDFDAMWNLNMRAVFLCSQQAIRMMEKQKSGIVVQISSLAGIRLRRTWRVQDTLQQNGL